MLFPEFFQGNKDAKENGQNFTVGNKRQKHMVPFPEPCLIKKGWRDIFWREVSFRAGLQISRTACRA